MTSGSDPHPWKRLAQVPQRELGKEVRQRLDDHHLRVRSALGRLIEQLDEAGYQFMATSPLQSISDLEAQLTTYEAAIGTSPPLVIESFWRVVGSVDLEGGVPDARPPMWAGHSRDSVLYADPLQVFSPARACRDALDTYALERGEDVWVVVCADRITKAGESGGDGPWFDGRTELADPVLSGMDSWPSPPTFSEYVTESIRAAGFPGIGPSEGPAWLRSLRGRWDGSLN